MSARAEAGGVKIAIIGGGSTYTPELVLELAKTPGVGTVVLHDIDEGRLGVVGGFVDRMFAHQGSAVRTHLTCDLDSALDGASFVLTQIRVGGSAARVKDETIALRHGFIGQETTGAGGFAMALRTVPVIVEIAERIRALAPEAFLVNFTNPAGLVAEAAGRAGVRCIGLCSIPKSFEDAFRAIHERAVDVESFGLNHLSWIRSVRVDGEDRLPEFLSTWPQGGDISRSVVDALGLLPNPYLRFYYSPARMLEAQQAEARTRADEVVELERATLERFGDPELTELPPELAQRGGSGYSAAAVAFVSSVIENRGDVQVLDVPNAAALEGFPNDAVVEVPCRVDASGATPIAQDPLPEHCLGLMRAVKSYERLTIDAALTGSRDTALTALTSHPLVGDVDRASALLDDILAAHADELVRWSLPPARPLQ
ncbi:MAG: 6-phospho-beta-glucosidase [Actinomycetota bacterium]